jgi:adenylate cyclase
VVKLIGDEVMYVSNDPTAACEIARRLTAGLTDHPRLPPVRGGIAYGSVLSRDGDFFGAVVNLAARAVKLAEPGTVLVSDEVRAASDLALTSIGASEIKGFDHPIELFKLAD